MHDHHGHGTVSAPTRSPVLAPWFACDFEHDRVTFRNGDMVAVMAGPAVSRYVAPVTSLLDGQRSVEEIAKATGLRVDQVRAVIAKLEDANLIIDGAGIPRSSPSFQAGAVAASCWGQLVDIAEATDRLSSSRVSIVGYDAVTRQVAQQLVDLGVQCSLLNMDATPEDELPDEALSCDLLIVGPSRVHMLARSVNQLLYEAKVSWLPVFPFNGRYAQVGPLIVPPDSGCFECFVLRRQANVSYNPDVYDWIERAGVKGPLDFAPVDHASAATAAFMVQQWLAVRHPEMPGLSYLERAGTWEREVHHLLRVPRCPVCRVVSERGIPAAWWSTP